MATTAEAKAFIEKVAPIVVKYAKQYNFKVASPIIAQACLESAYGQTSLGAANVNNFFGMKAGSSWKGAVKRKQTQEQKADGSYITIYSDFRAYPTMDEGIKGYFEFITGYSRYKKALTAATPRAYLQAIKDAGYATSIKYVDNNMNVVNKWELTKYDKLIDNAAVKEIYDEPTKCITSKSQAKLKGQKNYESTGSSVKWIQKKLEEAGYDFSDYGGIDGICGQYTVSCILDFQEKKGLVVDGLAGSETRKTLKNS